MQPPHDTPPAQITSPAPAHEPILRAPALAVLVALSMPLLYLLQVRLPDQGLAFAFRPIDLQHGEFAGLFTSMLLHSGWAHVLMNAVGALAFGAPVARLLSGVRGSVGFLAIYIVSGVIAALGYGLLHWGSDDLLVGASGAVFGLIGAATRLMDEPGRILPMTDRRVISTSLAWMGVNALVGLIGFAPGAQGGRIAWEAHAFGFVIGLASIGLAARAFGRPALESPRVDSGEV